MKPNRFTRPTGRFVVNDLSTEQFAPLTTCTIVTTGPNELMEPFHDRAPVQIPRKCGSPGSIPSKTPSD